VKKRPSKVLVFGLDGPVAPALLRYCREGKLPALSRLIENGVLAPNAMVPLPTATPANWTSIGTGAWPGTHGITDYNVHTPGDPLDRAHMAFHSPDVKAEYVWNAIARAGKKSVVVNYVTTWPPVVNDGIQIGGSGCDINQWFYPNLVCQSRETNDPTPQETSGSVRLDEAGLGLGEAAPGVYAANAYGGLFCTDAFQPDSRAVNRIDLRPPEGWSNLPAAARILEADLVLRPVGGWHALNPPAWHMLVLDSEGTGFDRVLVCEAKDAASPIAMLAPGQWSRILRREFQTAVGSGPCAFALKLLELSPDAQDLRLYHSSICALDGWSKPASLAAEIESEQGLPNPDSGYFGYRQGWFGDETLLEEIEMQRQWYADACTYVLKNKPWDLFVMRYHLPDTSWHSISEVLDETRAESAEERRRHEALELGIYEACDRLARDLIACIDEEQTLLALISDHGAKPPGLPGINANRILEDAGLLVRNGDGGIDWSKTRAVARPVVWIHINLRGREPEGVVEPGAEYRQVQEQVIEALTDYVDPASGRKPVLFALRKKDARVLNIHGDMVGDVVYALKDDFGGEHGPFLPTADYRGGAMRGLFALSGPGVRKGVSLDRNVWCVDLVPTICHLAGWPVPRDAEGAVIYQAFSDEFLA
jgi:predicted AlkP superfamily phosphohydrolase/phosphomutase